LFYSFLQALKLTFLLYSLTEKYGIFFFFLFFFFYIYFILFCFVLFYFVLFYNFFVFEYQKIYSHISLETELAFTKPERKISESASQATAGLSVRWWLDENSPNFTQCVSRGTACTSNSILAFYFYLFLKLLLFVVFTICKFVLEKF
jgi:hypothetical protein